MVDRESCSPKRVPQRRTIVTWAIPSRQEILLGTEIVVPQLASHVVPIFWARCVKRVSHYKLKYEDTKYKSVTNVEGREKKIAILKY